MAIIDDFVAINQQCKKLFPKVFDNESMTPHITKMCLKCNGTGKIILPSPVAGGKSKMIECAVCNGKQVIIECTL